MSVRYAARQWFGVPVNGWGRRNHVVKIIQRGTIALAAGVATNTATIVAVNMNNAVVHSAGNTGDSGSASYGTDTIDLQLTNATTVTATNGQLVTTDTITVPYQVIEYFPGVLKSLQRGTITLTSGQASNTATITQVDTTRAVIVWSGCRETSTNGYGTPQKVWVDLVLTNSTTVTLARFASGTFTFTVPYQVAEFY